jgi:hypothetical protein
MPATADGSFQLIVNEALTMLNWHQTELARKEANLIAVVEKRLPEFARTCPSHDTPVVVMHQDASTANYQAEEYRLIGLVIVYDSHAPRGPLRADWSLAGLSVIAGGPTSLVRKPRNHNSTVCSGF